MRQDQEDELDDEEEEEEEDDEELEDDDDSEGGGEECDCGNPCMAYKDCYQCVFLRFRVPLHSFSNKHALKSIEPESGTDGTRTAREKQESQDLNGDGGGAGTLHR